MMFVFERMYLNRCSQQTFRKLRANAKKNYSISRGLELHADRIMSMAQERGHPSLVRTPFFSTDEKEEFMAIFPDIIKDLTKNNQYADISEVNERIGKLLEYNLLKCRKTWGLWATVSYKMFENPETLTAANVKLANILTWCVQMWRGAFTIFDDLMDNSEFRYGHPCWHRMEDVGIAAANDGWLMDSCIYTLLQKHFGEKKCYRHITDVFRDITTKATMGQALDMMCKNRDGTPRLENFNMDRYNTIAKYKTGPAHTYLPVATGMYFANRYDPEERQQVERICIDLGMFYQKQNDYLDCFGDQGLVKKDCTDIKEGKCSWVAVTALERATPAQRKIMLEHYGRADNNSVQMVKQLYLELDLPAVFAAFEKESFHKVCTQIEQAKGLPHELFYRMVSSTFGNAF